MDILAYTDARRRDFGTLTQCGGQGFRNFFSSSRHFRAVGDDVCVDDTRAVN